MCNKTLNSLTISNNKSARIMEFKNNKYIKSLHKRWRAPSPEENNRRTIDGTLHIWENNPDGSSCWRKLESPVPTNISISNFETAVTSLSSSLEVVAAAVKATYSAITHEAIEVQGFPWTPDNLSNHFTAAAIAAAVAVTPKPFLNHNTTSTVSTTTTTK